VGAAERQRAFDTGVTVWSVGWRASVKVLRKRVQHSVPAATSAATAFSVAVVAASVAAGAWSVVRPATADPPQPLHALPGLLGIHLAQDEPHLRRVLAPLGQDPQRAVGGRKGALVVAELLQQREAPRAAHGVGKGDNHVLSGGVHARPTHHALNPVHPHLQLHSEVAQGEWQTHNSECTKG
jgi:hypothetical protein